MTYNCTKIIGTLLEVLRPSARLVFIIQIIVLSERQGLKRRNQFSVIEKDCILCTVRTEAEGAFEHPALKMIGYELRISTFKLRRVYIVSRRSSTASVFLRN